MVDVREGGENGRDVGSLFSLFTHFLPATPPGVTRHKSCEGLTGLTRVGHVTSLWAESVIAHNGVHE